MKFFLPLFAAALFFLPHSLPGQSIEELFVSFPGKIMGDTYPTEAKQAYLSTTKLGEFGNFQSSDPDEESHGFKLAILDKRNGFLRLDDLDNYVDFCYWNKSNGHKLVAVCHTTTVAYLESELELYDYFQGEWTLLKTDSVFQHPEYWDVLDIGATLEANQGKALPLDHFSYATEIRLPQKGKNILVRFEMVDFTDEKGEELEYELVYKAQQQGLSAFSELWYFWNDGVFLKE